MPRYYIGMMFQIRYYNSLLKYLETEGNGKNIVSPTSIGITNPELNNLIIQFIQQNAKKEEINYNHMNYKPLKNDTLSIEHRKKIF